MAVRSPGAAAFEVLHAAFADLETLRSAALAAARPADPRYAALLWASADAADARDALGRAASLAGPPEAPLGAPVVAGDPAELAAQAARRVAAARLRCAGRKELAQGAEAAARIGALLAPAC